MPNELRFDVQFTRSQIEELLKNPDVTLVVVAGTYTYEPKLGKNVWDMRAYAEGYDDSDVKIEGTIVDGCPRPCPS